MIEPSTESAVRARLPDGSVAPFPRERFEAFLAAQTIISRDAGLVPFAMLQSQKYLIDEIEAAVARGITNIMVLKARGGGISTILLLLDIFWSSEYPGTLGAFVVQDEQARDQFRAQIDVIRATMHKRFRIAAQTNNRLMLVWLNSSILRFLVAGTRHSGTNKLGRSGHTNYRHLTESAFYASGEDIKTMDQAMSELHPHRLSIEETTANGFNHFEERWRIALDSPAQQAIFIGWWRDERNEFGEGHPLYLSYMPKGRKSPLSAREKRGIADVKRAYGFEITSGQIAWYRFHLAVKCKGDQSTMDQEMPWTPEDAFQSTGAQYFSNECLTVQMREAREMMCRPFAFRLTRRWEEIEIFPATIQRCDLKIWELPSPWGQYSIGCDPSLGVGKDNGVISVLRCYADETVQVAEYASNSATVQQQAWVLAFLAGLYQNAMVNLELSGPGGPLLQELERCQEYSAEMPLEQNPDFARCLAHMRHFLYRRIDSMSSSLVKQFRTTADLKDLLLTRFKDACEIGVCRIRSLTALQEMRRIVEEEGYLGGAESFHDDRVIAAALGYYAWDQWLRRGLMQRNLTRANAAREEKNGGPDPVEGLVRRFFQKAKIEVRKDQML